MSKREHILDTAEALFNGYGFHAVGVDRIRDEAAVSKTSMYRHFGSKAALTSAVLERRHERFREQLEAALAQAGSAEEKLQALCQWHLDWFGRPDFQGCMFIHALAEFKNEDAAIRAIALQHKQWLSSLFLSCGADQQQAGILLTLLEGMIVRAEFGDLPHSAGHCSRAMQSLLQAG